MRWPVWIAGCIAFTTFLCAVGGTARAHQSSFTYASLSRSAGQVDYEIRLSTGDLFEALSLGEDRDASDDEIQAGAEALQSYVGERVQLSVPGQSCEKSVRPVAVVMDGQRFAQVRTSLRCPERIAAVDVHYELFFDLDARHEGLLRIDEGLVQLTTNRREYRHVFGKTAPETNLGFFISGAKHVLYGMDHILFLVSLMMVMGLRREGGMLRRRTRGETVRNAGLVATAFTLGHSITLVVAALGWIWLPSRFVESMIAASIVYVAVENVFRPDPPRRYVLTFVFGLIHGLGFASMLRPLLPPEGVILPLLVFNVGVEAGQIVVLAAAIPVLGVVIGGFGVRRYRRYLLPCSSVLLAASGLMWLAERALLL